jgi:hypothetical protein
LERIELFQGRTDRALFEGGSDDLQPWEKSGCAFALMAPRLDSGTALNARSIEELLSGARLADSGFAREENQTGVMRASRCKGRSHCCKFSIPPNERS